MVGATVQRTENGQTVNISSNYAYNHSGMRVRANSTANGITHDRRFLLDEMNHTGYSQILEESNNGSLVKSYVIGDDILSQSSTIGVRHFLYDGHGSTRMLTDTAGGITSRYDYDAYGIMVGGNPNLANPAETDMLYSGEQFDRELQMQYLRARFYDQNTGRFPSMDTYGGNGFAPQSLHKYSYCNGNPVNSIDPSGEFGIIETIAVMAVGITLFTLTGCSDKVAIQKSRYQRHEKEAQDALYAVAYEKLKDADLIEAKKEADIIAKTYMDTFFKYYAWYGKEETPRYFDTPNCDVRAGYMCYQWANKLLNAFQGNMFKQFKYINWVGNYGLNPDNRQIGLQHNYVRVSLLECYDNLTSPPNHKSEVFLDPWKFHKPNTFPSMHNTHQWNYVHLNNDAKEPHTQWGKLWSGKIWEDVGFLEGNDLNNIETRIDYIR